MRVMKDVANGRGPRPCAIALLSCFGALALPAHASTDGGWDWMIAPYAWAAGVNTNLRTNTPPNGGIATDTEFDDVIDKIDGAFEVHAEGQGEHFGAFADFTYLGLADGHDRARFHTESDLDTRLLDVAGVWNFSGRKFEGLELMAGLRYIDVDFSARFVPTNPAFGASSIDTGKSFYDFMLGARYTWRFNDRWGMTLRGDGSFGDTEGTWNASIVGQYNTHHGAWVFGYRYLDVSLEPDDRHLDITVSGVVVGYGFRF